MTSFVLLVYARVTVNDDAPCPFDIMSVLCNREKKEREKERKKWRKKKTLPVRVF